MLGKWATAGEVIAAVATVQCKQTTRDSSGETGMAKVGKGIQGKS
jgi:hypothetical protein